MSEHCINDQETTAARDDHVKLPAAFGGWRGDMA